MTQVCTRFRLETKQDQEKHQDIFEVHNNSQDMSHDVIIFKIVVFWWKNGTNFHHAGQSKPGKSTAPYHVTIT